MAEHEIHHRGQIYLYLGMLGVPTPPLYGLTSEEVLSRSISNFTEENTTRTSRDHTDLKNCPTDFCGPFEVFSVTGRRDNSNPFNVYTVAQERRPVLARNELSVNPRYTLADCPAPDILIIPGGFGTRREMNNAVVLDWVKRLSPSTEHLLSVCTGDLILAKAGLLEGLVATTHHGAISLLQEIAPNTKIDASKRFIDNSKIIVSAGISAGIDMSLYVVAKLLGKAQAWETAKYMEYDWRPEA